MYAPAVHSGLWKQRPIHAYYGINTQLQVSPPLWIKTGRGFYAYSAAEVSVLCLRRLWMLPVHRGSVRLFQQSPGEHTANPGNPAQLCPSGNHPCWLSLGEAKLIYSQESVSSLPVTLQNISKTPKTSQLLTQRESHNVFHLRTNYSWGRNIVLCLYRTIYEKLENRSLECRRSKHNKLILQIRLCQKSAVSLELFHAVPWHKYH